MILIIGYGNPLRSDDGVGHRVIEALEQRRLQDDVNLMTVHQLTPELVEIIRAARCVIFVDARSGGTPGSIVREVVRPEATIASFTHHVSPATLLGATYELYGVCPHGILFSVTGSSFAFGETLSPYVRLAVPLVLLAIEDILRNITEKQMA